MKTTTIHRPTTESRATRPIVTFRDEFGDETTGAFLGIEPGPRQPILILVGGRIIKRATRALSGADRPFDLTFA